MINISLIVIIIINSHVYISMTHAFDTSPGKGISFRFPANGESCSPTPFPAPSLCPSTGCPDITPTSAHSTLACPESSRGPFQVFSVSAHKKTGV
ncbi:unnamed protein product, partial [Staurois parvus]